MTARLRLDTELTKDFVRIGGMVEASNGSKYDCVLGKLTFLSPKAELVLINRSIPSEDDFAVKVDLKPILTAKTATIRRELILNTKLQAVRYMESMRSA